VDSIGCPETSVANLRRVQISFAQWREPEIIYDQVTVQGNVMALGRRQY